MTGQRYKRTNFEDDDTFSNGPSTPTGIDFFPSVALKHGLSAWQRKTRLERVLIVFLVALLIAVIVLASLLSVHKESVKIITKIKNITLDAEYCLTTNCVTLASSLLASIDPTVNPCEDFYQYACGGWKKKHPIPPGHSHWSTFGELVEQNQVVMKNILDRPLSEAKNEAERKAILYFLSCMDKNGTIDDLAADPLLQMISNLGGWNISSVSGDWDPDKWDLQNMIEKVFLLELNSFFSFWVGEDDKNSSRNLIQVDQGGITIPDRAYYLNKSISEDKVLSAYLEYMTEVGVLLGGDRNETERQMREVIEFETTLAQITSPSSEKRDLDKKYNNMTVAELGTLAPFLDWQHFFRTLFKVVNITITPDHELILSSPAYMKNLTMILDDMISTPEKRNVLNNYMIWRVVESMSSYVTQPFKQASKILTKAISGISGDRELWRYCVSDTDNVLGFALGAMFVREAFQGDSKPKAEEMVMEIKDAFTKNLPDLKWMDDETRRAAVDKANAVVDMIGFPQYILNSTRLNGLYKELEINPNEYFENNVRNLRFALESNLKQLNRVTDKTIWSMSPPTVNAYYTPSKNEIVFPAGILQAPFYDTQSPMSLNFGAMGVVIGHELTHGFDDQGRSYDKFGNFRSWWNNDSVVRFTERADCMTDQYSKYTVNGEKVDGKLTLGENIADNGGLKAAFHAYGTWTQAHGREKTLPSLNLTNEQLFFLGFAQVWCSSTTVETSHLELLNDPHSPAKFRVIGTLSNSKEFAENFKCPLDSRMNPSKKCVVW